MLRRIAVILLFAALSAAGVFADGELGVNDLLSAGLSGNLDLQKARRTLADAGKALPWQSELASTQAKLSGSYTSAGQLSGQAQLTVPIIPQVSVGAGVSSKGTADASLNLTPLAAWRTRYKEKADYLTAKTQLDYQTAKLGYDIPSAAYALLQASTNVSIAKAKLELQAERADIATKTYELGELTYDDFQSARSNLIAARQSEFDAERALLNARVQLYRLLGPAAGEPGVKSVSLDDLSALIAARDREISSADKAKVSSLALRQAEVGLDSLKAQLAATPAYRPSLSLSAQLSYGPPEPQSTAAYVFSGSGSISYSFSPSEIKTDDRAALLESIAVAERQVELERMALQLQGSIGTQALAVARQALEAAQGDLLQAEATLKSTELLFKEGQRTSVDVEDARIGVESARMRIFGAAASVLDAQAQILLSYSL